ncbi:hypothetical protein [Actinorugispora endophytica]|uniref:Uncharacterized protein n=1 Tax=Actinorugispora endophytica TaxID=1605990 RepID=A0A4R6V0G9_9ACTN|nr:hypothetical protein [Actinorugispora endophytica]TDQ53444.1 hypothetical protein EV190_104234 [Actinorugispora endophytica]
MSEIDGPGDDQPDQPDRQVERKEAVEEPQAVEGEGYNAESQEVDDLLGEEERPQAGPFDHLRDQAGDIGRTLQDSGVEHRGVEDGGPGGLKSPDTGPRPDSDGDGPGRGRSPF